MERRRPPSSTQKQRSGRDGFCQAQQQPPGAAAAAVLPVRKPVVAAGAAGSVALSRAQLLHTAVVHYGPHPWRLVTPSQQGCAGAAVTCALADARHAGFFAHAADHTLPCFEELASLLLAAAAHASDGCGCVAGGTAIQCDCVALVYQCAWKVQSRHQEQGMALGSLLPGWMSVQLLVLVLLR